MCKILNALKFLGYWFTGTETYDIKWSMPHCVLTLRLIGLAFDVYDGHKKVCKNIVYKMFQLKCVVLQEPLSKDQVSNAIRRIPTLLEVAGYTYFPASFMVGPQFPMARYLQMIYGTLKPEVQNLSRWKVIRNKLNFFPRVRKSLNVSLLAY
jgi:lysophospholipid acyltransferase 5